MKYDISAIEAAAIAAQAWSKTVGDQAWFGAGEIAAFGNGSISSVDAVHVEACSPDAILAMCAALKAAKDWTQSQGAQQMNERLLRLVAALEPFGGETAK
jgi:hypothetical protein